MYGTAPRQAQQRPGQQQRSMSQPAVGRGDPRTVPFTPERQRRGPMQGYTPSPAPERRQVFDQWGRPIVQPPRGGPSMSPAPVGMHGPRAAAGSPAKGGLGMTLRNDMQVLLCVFVCVFVCLCVCVCLGVVVTFCLFLSLSFGIFLSSSLSLSLYDPLMERG
jgi:hypothetical protein